MRVNRRQNSGSKIFTPKWIAIIGLLLVAVLLRLAGWKLAQSEQLIHVKLVCSGDTCVATVNDNPPITAILPAEPHGQRLGFYTYHPNDIRADRQFFRQFAISTDNESKRFMLLRHAEDGPTLEGNSAFHVVPGYGLAHTGQEGERAAALLKDTDCANFRVEFDLLHAVDAGLIFRATDSRNGVVFVIRPRDNDAFFFSLNEGDPEAIMAMAPLTEMTAGREAIRLASLLSDIGLRAIILLTALTIVVRLVRRKTVQYAEKKTPTWIHTTSFYIMAAGVTFVLLAVISHFSLHRMPHIEDENAYYFQAKVFAEGALWAPAPQQAEFFKHEHMIMMHGRWFSKYPPLWSGLLALGMKLGIPWMVNPLLGALLAITILLLGRRIAGRQSMVLIWLLTLSSPFFLFMGASMMSHTTTALFISLSLLCYLVGVDDDRPRVLVTGGVCLGLAFLARPYTAALAAIPMIIDLGWQILCGPQRRRLFLAGLGFAVCVLLLVLLFFGWSMVSAGSASEGFGLHTSYDHTDSLGFGPDKGTGWLMTWGSWGHTPAKGLHSVYRYLELTARHLFGWPALLSFAFVLVPLPLLRRRRPCLILLGVFLCLVIGHMFYWSTNHFSYGVRYWFSGLPGLIILTAMGINVISNPVAPEYEADHRSPGRILVLAVIGGMILWNAMYYLPRRAAAGYNYGNTTPALREEVSRLSLTNALVFVKTEGLLYNEGFYMNDPFLKEGCIFARDLEAHNSALVEQHPDRAVYYWNRSSLIKAPNTPLHTMDTP